MSGELYINSLFKGIDVEIHKVFPSIPTIDSLTKQLIELGVYPNIENINEIVIKHGVYWFLVPGLIVNKNGLGRCMKTYMQ